VGVDPGLLREQCARTLDRTDFPALGQRFEGKVRDSYVARGRRTIVVSDRVSCFDRVVGTLPFKGQVLNQVAAFWFERTREIARNHLIAVPDPVVSVVEDVTPLPVEFVMRGHLTGSTSTSIWTAYARGERTYCGHRLRDGMHKHEPLPEPLLTPTTKAEHGGHDEPASREQLISSGAIDAATFDRAAAMAHALFREGTRFAATRGLILVDTKYEIGVDAKGELLLIDEIHTPDSSRYWYRDRYERALREGADPEALDKEYLRRWLGEQGYRGEGPVPEIPLDVRCEAARRYIEAFEQVTGQAFEPNIEEPLGRIRRNLGIA
jgi:phosphoribosylaminoimidazole-succinocarboxamide synthase